MEPERLDCARCLAFESPLARFTAAISAGCQREQPDTPYSACQARCRDARNMLRFTVCTPSPAAR